MEEHSDPKFIRARVRHYHELADAAEDADQAKQYWEIAEAFEREARRREGWMRPRPSTTH